jgi:hypothetical protein
MGDKTKAGTDDLLAEAARDPWAATQELADRRHHELAVEHEQTLREREAHRHERRTMLWHGVGYALVVLSVLSVFVIIGAVIYGFHHSDQVEQVKVEEQRTARVKQCLSLEDTAERELCVIGSASESAPGGK